MNHQGDSPANQRWRPLADPRFLLAVLLLGLNDHLFKAVWPGFLTGKLSDFAGPIAVAVIVACIAGRSPRAVAVGIAVAASAMIAAKTSAQGAESFEHALRTLTGTQQQIIADPTDLVGLVGLFVVPALVARPKPIVSARWFRLTALVIGAGLCVATSAIEPEVLNDLRLGDDNSIIVTTFDDAFDDYRATRVLDTDGTWVRGENFNDLETTDIGTQGVLCLSRDSQHCFRGFSDLGIEESDNGGETWDVAWSVNPDEAWLELFEPDLDWLDSLNTGDLYETNEGELIVAMGVLDPVTRSADGTWSPSTNELQSIPTIPWMMLAIGLALAGLGLGLALAAREGGEIVIGILMTLLAVPSLGAAVWFWVGNETDGLFLPWLFLLGLVCALPATVLYLIGTGLWLRHETSRWSQIAWAFGLLALGLAGATAPLVLWSSESLSWNSARLLATGLTFVAIVAMAIASRILTRPKKPLGTV